MGEKLIPLAAMEKMLRQGGAHRVSEKGKAALKEVLEQIAHDISVKASKFAVHAGRKTVKAEDIKLAVRE